MLANGVVGDALDVELHHIVAGSSLIRSSDDGARCNERQRLERILDFDREHLVAPYDEHVFAAIADLDVALVVHESHVSGEHPGAAVNLAQRSAVCLGQRQIPDHHLRPGSRPHGVDEESCSADVKHRKSRSDDLRAHAVLVEHVALQAVHEHVARGQLRALG